MSWINEQGRYAKLRSKHSRASGKVDWLHALKWTSWLSTDVNQCIWPPLCIGPAGGGVSESVRPAYVAVNSVLIENTCWTGMSTRTRILGTAAYMLKWKYKEQDMSTLRRMAETLLFKVTQETQFSKEIDLLQRGKPLPYIFSSKLYRFAPFLHEDGLLRIGGRMRMAEWDFDRRHPILLGKHYLTEVFILSHHIQKMHQGVDALLTFNEQILDPWWKEACTYDNFRDNAWDARGMTVHLAVRWWLQCQRKEFS